MNLILNTDSYKASHFCQYPENTKFISSYVEARGGEYSRLLFFGLQPFIKEYLQKPITAADISQAEKIIRSHGLPFWLEGWQYILNEHNGYLPLFIEAVPEGSVLPVGNVVCQITNTDPKCFWLTSYIETALLRAIWYPTTVATRSYFIKQNLNYYLNKTADDKSGLDFMLHDFGSRGCSSQESSALGGMGHLINFVGSDNLVAIAAAQKFYQASMAGFSIPAAEHSTITSWGEAREADAYRNIIEQFSGSPAVSIVSDSYDLFSAINNLWGRELKSTIENYSGVVVIRPDSGEPVSVVKKCLHLLSKHFGYGINAKGYKVLPDNIRLIQGDGVSERAISEILHEITNDGFSADNLVFGMGGELLQKVNRDTLGFAMKVSAISDGKIWTGVAKAPKTDNFKASRKGRLALVDSHTIQLSELGASTNMLVPVFKNGKLIQSYSWSEVKERSQL